MRDQGEMAVALKELRTRARDVGSEPFTVRERHHSVLIALPNGDRDANGAELESPGSGESEIVVAPARDSCGHSPPEAVGHDLGVVAGQRPLVDLADESTERGRYVGSGHFV